jgi:hypothetical protein
MLETHLDTNKLHEITTGEFQGIGSKVNVKRYTATTFMCFLENSLTKFYYLEPDNRNIKNEIWGHGSIFLEEQ